VTPISLRRSDRRPAGDGLLAVRLPWPEEFAKAHEHHGQFVVVQPSGLAAAEGSSYFVLANTPGAAEAELLVRPRGAAGIALAEADEILLGGPRGAGFGPLAEAAPLVAVVTGSALASVRSLVAARPATAPTTLFLGMANGDDPPWPEFLAELAERGVVVRTAASDAQGAADHFGFVQAAVEAHFLAAPPAADTAVVVVGQRALTEKVRALCTRFSLAAPRSNF
jgi:NAD(P)H-flavin reductase